MVTPAVVAAILMPFPFFDFSQAVLSTATMPVDREIRLTT